MDDTFIGATSINMSTLDRSHIESSTMDGEDFRTNSAKELASTI